MDKEHHHFSRDRNEGVWIEHSDRLYCAAYSSVASLSVRFSGYFRKMDGEIIEYAVTVNPTSDRAVTEQNVFFGAGFLLSCVAALASGNANRGQCYVRAQVQRSTGAPMLKLHTVVAGYVTDDYSPSFPYGKLEGSLEGAGVIRNIVGVNQGAGNEIVETCPTGARWRFMELTSTYTAAAVAVSRYPLLQVYRANGATSRWGSNVAITTGQTIQLWYRPGAGNGAVTPTRQQISTPENLQMTAADFVGTFTEAMNAGDTYTAILYTVEEWIEA